MVKKKRGSRNKDIESKIKSEQGFRDVVGNSRGFKKTDFYKGLSKKDQKGFNNYLKNKEITVKFSLFIILLNVVFLISSKADVTGRLIENAVGEPVFNFAYYFCSILVILLLFLLLIQKFNK